MSEIIFVGPSAEIEFEDEPECNLDCWYAPMVIKKIRELLKENEIVFTDEPDLCASCPKKEKGDGEDPIRCNYNYNCQIRDDDR